jgi:peptidyl-prolyl cis-trans isomerase C
MRDQSMNSFKHIQRVSFCILIGLSHLAIAQEKTQVLGLINGEKIESKQLDEWLKYNPSPTVGGDLLTQRQAALNEIVARLAILQDAKKLKLAEYSDNQFKYRIAQENILIELWFENYLKKNPITEKDLQEEYDRQLALTQVGGTNAYQYQLTQIQLKTEREIKEVIRQLKSGADWMTLVKLKSIDPENMPKNDQIDWVFPNQLIPPIGEVVPRLNIGQFNDNPIRTSLGWHLIRVENKKVNTMPPFESVKQAITQILVKNKRLEAVDILLKQSLIEKAK